MKTTSYGKQTINNNDIKEVIRVLKSDFLTQGPKVSQFEKKLSNYFGSKYCSAVSSGTAALHLAGKALKWGKDDIVITTPNTFIASANAILYCDAQPELVDIEKERYNMDCNKLEETIQNLRKKNKRVNSVIAVDYAGHPCDWVSLRYLADKYQFNLINDNCHALGAKYKNSHKYAIKYADIVTQSYHPVKNITTGEGGAIFTKDQKTDKFIKSLRTHGVIKSKKIEKQHGSWFYKMENLGYNYRLTDFQAALGISQLNRIDEFVKKRNKIADYYNSILSNFSFLKVPSIADDVYHAFHIYPLQINFSKLKINKKIFFEKIKEKKINLQVHYIPIHLQPYYKKNFKINKRQLGNSVKFYKNECSLPIYPELNMKNIKKICDIIINEIKKY